MNIRTQLLFGQTLKYSKKPIMCATQHEGNQPQAVLSLNVGAKQVGLCALCAENFKINLQSTLNEYQKVSALYGKFD